MIDKKENTHREGVIQYSLDFTDLSVNVVSETDILEIDNLRRRLFARKLIGAYEDGVGYGNISCRFPEPASESFLITASRTGKMERPGPEFYTLVESYDLSTFTMKARGMHKPSSEAFTHAAVYRLHPRIQWVIHVHSGLLWTYMLNHNYLRTDDAFYGSKDMVDSIRELYQPYAENPDLLFLNNRFIMTGHEEGIVSFGRTSDEAENALVSLFDAIDSYGNTDRDPA